MEAIVEARRIMTLNEEKDPNMLPLTGVIVDFEERRHMGKDA